jgi:hypothetical protein
MPGVRKVPGRFGGEPTRSIDAATWCLIALVLAGVALRVVTEVGWWPTATTLADSSAYARFAESNPFADPQHPAGYALILAAIGSVTREVAVPVLLQHLAGIASALLLYAATRRVTASRWAGLLPAAIVLLNPDEILLEHAIMAESWAILATAGGLYATVRAFDEPVPLWRWPLLAGLLLAVSVTIRTAGLATIAVVLLGLLLAGGGRWRDRARWATPLAAGGGAVAILVAFAISNAAFGPRLGIGPSPGWYLYARAAQFADCERFIPPPGTEALCEQTPPDERRGARYYVFDPAAPAPRLFGAFPDQTDSEADKLLGSWAKRAVLAQPLDYAESVWDNLRAYWVPSLMPVRAGEGEGLDPLLDYRLGADEGFFGQVQLNVAADMEAFFDPFTLDRREAPLAAISDWQQISRFGGTMLSIATVLMLIGLFGGTRRERLGVLVLGAGGLAMIVAPALTGNYTGRYTVPMAGPMLAGAAIAIVAIARRVRARRRGAGDPIASAPC